MRIALPEKVNRIIGGLKSRGFDAYAVGGCVRDSLLGRTPGDWDITTSARPQQVKEIFPRTVDTGIAHGTVTVLLEREGFEVTTYRIDGEYEDARHPREVVFTPDLPEDLKRRDFTINAMAYNEDAGLVDIFDGIGDMRRKLIRCVGDPRERFGEDALRMLRAVRFAAQLGFAIEEGTREAIRELAPALEQISAERIQAELTKLLVSPHPEEMRTVYELGIADVILPEFSAMMETTQNNPHHIYTVGEHTLEALKHVRPDKVLRLTMLLHDVAKPVCRTADEEGVHHFKGHPQKGAEMAGQILRRLKFDNDTIRQVTALVRTHDERPALTPQSIRRAIHRNGPEQYPAVFAVQRADVLAQSSYYQKHKLHCLDEYERLFLEIRQKGQCLSLKDLAVKGSDLIAAGMKPGKELGKALDGLLQAVLDQPELNDRETLLELWRQISANADMTGNSDRETLLKL